MIINKIKKGLVTILASVAITVSGCSNLPQEYKQINLNDPEIQYVIREYKTNFQAADFLRQYSQNFKHLKGKRDFTDKDIAFMVIKAEKEINVSQITYPGYSPR